MRRLSVASVILFCASACLQDNAATSQSQRRISEVRLQDDLFLSLTYGSVRGFTSDAVVMRSASPLVQISSETGPDAEGPISVELRNQHLDAQLRVASVHYLDSEDLDGCPVVSGVAVDCVAASAELGAVCETSGQCPSGLRCAAGSCQPTQLFEGCEAPDYERLRGQETSIKFELSALPCQRVRLETVVPDDALSPLRFAVLGPTRDVELISSLGDEFREAELDFVLLLGDHVDAVTEGGLARLERTLTQLGTPAVVLAGPRETATESGAEFLRRFGPHDHIWRLKGTRFFAFYSAPGVLGPRGLDRLRSFLLQLEPAFDDADFDDADDSVLIGATHVPPFDPNGLRDDGFRSKVEAAQVMSTLETHGVHQLFAGGLAAAEDRVHGVEVVVTTAKGTIAAPYREWILVEIIPEAVPDLGRVVGQSTIVREHTELE